MATDMLPTDDTHTTYRTQGVDGAVYTLRNHGMDSLADRLAFLDGLAADGPDEDTIDPQSAFAFVDFLLSSHTPYTPDIGISPGGSIQAVWHSRGHIMSADFVDDTIVFAVVADGWSSRGVAYTHDCVNPPRHLDCFMSGLFDPSEPAAVLAGQHV